MAGVPVEAHAAVEGLQQVADIAEQEEQRGHQHEFVERQVQDGVAVFVAEVEEGAVEDIAADLSQVEDIGGQPDAERDRQHTRNGQDGLPDEVVEPGHGDVGVFPVGLVDGVLHLVFQLALDQVLFLVLLHQDIEGCDGLDGRELEQPPNKDLDAQQDIAHPGHDGGDEHHGEGDPGIDHVAAGFPVVAHFLAEAVLPDGEAQHQRREDEVDQPVRNEDDAEGDHDQTQQGDGYVDLRHFPDVLRRDAHQQGDQDGGQQPGIDEQQPRSLLEEILLDEQAGDHYRHGKDYHAAQERGHQASLFKGIRFEKGDPLFQQMDHDVAQQGGQADVEEDEQDEA